MKIFDWVHRRFIPKDGLGQNVKKDDPEILNNEAETKGLLHESMVEYQGLNGSILSIGTFGLLKDDLSIMMIGNNHHDEELFDGLMDKNIDGDQNKLELEFEDAEDDHDHDQDNHEEEDDDEEPEGEWNPLLLYEKRRGGGAKQILSQMDPPPTEEDADRDPLYYYRDLLKQENRTERRITLADLFSAESDGDEDDDGTTNAQRETETYYCSSKVSPRPISTANKKLTTTTAPNTGGAAPKNGILFAKKLIPLVKEDSRPIQKLHGLMKRMLKRKIHPDVNLEANKHIKPCAATGILPSNCMAQFGMRRTVSPAASPN